MRQHLARPHRVLFLCTGNYYRSRFAEELFNWLAPQAGLSWTATSRGIATEFGVFNVGPISPHALRCLLARSIPPTNAHCFPQQLQEQDLLMAGLAIALKEAEHRPLLEQRFPCWGDCVIYWHVDDLDLARPEDALAGLERRVSDLVDCLSDSDHDLPQAADSMPARQSHSRATRPPVQQNPPDRHRPLCVFPPGQFVVESPG